MELNSDNKFPLNLYGKESMMLRNLILVASFLTNFLLSSQEIESDVEETKKWVNTGDNVTKIFNDYEIDEGEHVTGNLKIIGGDLTVKGTVSGEITVIGGDINILSTAVINGRIVSIGGNIEKDPNAKIKGEIVQLGVDQFSISREEKEGEDGEIEEKDTDSGTAIPSPSISEPYKEDGWMRYNRAEGFYLQGNKHIQSDYVPGLALFAGVGRSFHIPGWRGTLGFEQFILNNSLQFFIEGYDRSHTDDTWRISDKENSMAAFFIHQDFLDWYRTTGYRVGAELHLPWNLNLNATYVEEEQDTMPTVVNWSMFGGDKVFRNGFDITPGTEHTAAYGFSIGTPYSWMDSEQLSWYINAIRTESQDGSDFTYEKDQLQLQTYIPFKEDLGFHFNILTGNILDTTNLGKQHKFFIGGIGSLRGYDWKSMTGTQFLSTTVEIVFDDVSVFYDRGITSEISAGALFDSQLIEKYNDSGFESVGLSLGAENSCRVDIIKPLTGDDTDIKINLRLVW